jgi:hypothetical protein
MNGRSKGIKLHFIIGGKVKYNIYLELYSQLNQIIRTED